MTKNDLAKELAVSEKLHLSTAVKAIDGLIRILKENLVKGEDIFLRGFGTLAVVHREQRPARNLSSGETIIVPAHRSVKFRPGADLKNLLSNVNVD